MTISAMCLTRLLSAKVFTSKNVLAMRDNLQVCRVDACAIRTQMIDFQAVRDRPVHEFIAEPMCINRLAPNPELAIAIRLD